MDKCYIDGHECECAEGEDCIAVHESQCHIAQKTDKELEQAAKGKG